MVKHHFDIVFVADNNYAPYTAVTLQSLFDHHSQWDFDIWLVSCDFSEENTLKYISFCQHYQAKFHLVPVALNELDDFEGIGFWSKYTFLKLLIAVKLPHSVKTALYLDGDVLITDKLDMLFGTSIDDKSLAAVEDLCFVMDKNMEQFNLASSAICINSGVMLLNLDKWRLVSKQNRFVSFLDEWKGKFSLCDQDVINNVFVDQIVALPLRYNLTHFCFGFRVMNFLTPSHRLQWKEARKHPAIVHFTNNTKPWIWETTHQYKSLYISTARSTPYAQNFEIPFSLAKLGKKMHNLFRYTLMKIVDFVRLNF